MRATTYLPDDRISDSIMLMLPSGPYLVTTRNEDGSINVAPFGWVMNVSWAPPVVAAALVDTPTKQQTLINIERDGEFVINVPDLDLAEKLVKCSYRFPPQRNKFVDVGFEEATSRKVKVPGIGEVRARIECRMTDSLVPGDHKLIIGDVLAACYDPQSYGPNLLLKLDVATPCMHLGHFKREGGQVHFFLAPSDAHFVDVAYDGTKSHDAPWIEAMEGKG